ncbi:paraquat-inducible protein A [Orrella sp. 11846]|uniref:paraquat-inducible protein A n=1 Tax=Orrella sp. 11846 TaxID=3409913 RepID=UPI003B599C91
MISHSDNLLSERLRCTRCDAVYERLKLSPGQQARCVRCETVLESFGAFGPSAWLALILTAFVAFVLANTFPVLTLSFGGSHNSTTFLQAAWMAWEAGFPEVMVLTGLVGFLIPLLHLCLLLWVFVPLSMGHLPLGFKHVIAMIDWIKPWSMIPVFLIGVLVTIVKLLALAGVELGIGLGATAVLAVLMTAFNRLNATRLKRMAGDLGLMHNRVVLAPPTTRMLQRTWALVIAALILYIPANFLPIMVIDSVGSLTQHTIMGGVIELWNMGSFGVALVVFVASFLVPMTKLVALILLLIGTQRAYVDHLRLRTRLYNAVEIIGQWSMLDVFVVILLSALARFGNLLSIKPAVGAAAFGGVVVLTMIAAMGFDPRLAWRRAGYKPYSRSIS